MMCSISCLRLALFFLFLGAANGLTITSTTKAEDLPRSEADPSNPNGFFVIYKNKREQLTCPRGYRFDQGVMHCVASRSSGSDLRSTASDVRIPVASSVEGLFPNPENCRQFFNCGSGSCWLQTCSLSLLFSNETQVCDYPFRANCCEYRAVNPNKLF